jgi:hypothetical protein
MSAHTDRRHALKRVLPESRNEKLAPPPRTGEAQWEPRSACYQAEQSLKRVPVSNVVRPGEPMGWAATGDPTRGRSMSNGRWQHLGRMPSKLGQRNHKSTNTFVSALWELSPPGNGGRLCLDDYIRTQGRRVRWTRRRGISSMGEGSITHGGWFAIRKTMKSSRIFKVMGTAKTAELHRRLMWTIGASFGGTRPFFASALTGVTTFFWGSESRGLRQDMAHWHGPAGCVSP